MVDVKRSFPVWNGLEGVVELGLAQGEVFESGVEVIWPTSE